MSKLSRTKGHSYERKIAKRFRDEKLFPEAKRHLEYQSSEAELGQDLDNTEPFAFQLKRGKRYAPITAIEEVKRFEGKIPALITKGDRKDDVVCLYLDDFIGLLIDLNFYKNLVEDIQENS